MKYFLLEELTDISFFHYLCSVGTLLVCYSVPRQVEDGCENETWKSCFKVLVSLITVCTINLMNMKKEDSALIFVVFVGWSFCTETYGRCMDG